MTNEPHIPRPTIDHTVVPVTFAPFNSTSPQDTGTMPMIARRRVVFPAPFGPTIPTVFADGTLIETSHSTLIVP